MDSASIIECKDHWLGKNNPLIGSGEALRNLQHIKNSLSRPTTYLVYPDDKADRYFMRNYDKQLFGSRLDIFPDHSAEMTVGKVVWFLLRIPNGRWKVDDLIFGVRRNLEDAFSHFPVQMERFGKFVVVSIRLLESSVFYFQISFKKLIMSPSSIKLIVHPGSVYVRNSMISNIIAYSLDGNSLVVSKCNLEALIHIPGQIMLLHCSSILDLKFKDFYNNVIQVSAEEMHQHVSLSYVPCSRPTTGLGISYHVKDYLYLTANDVGVFSIQVIWDGNPLRNGKFDIVVLCEKKMCQLRKILNQGNKCFRLLAYPLMSHTTSNQIMNAISRSVTGVNHDRAYPSSDNPWTWLKSCHEQGASNRFLSINSSQVKVRNCFTHFILLNHYHSWHYGTELIISKIPPSPSSSSPTLHHPSLGFSKSDLNDSTFSNAFLLGTSNELVILESEEYDLIFASLFAMIQSYCLFNTTKNKVKSIRQSLEYSRSRVNSLQVSRSCILKSGLSLFNLTRRDWHSRILVSFIGEASIDFGGPGKEFFSLLAKEIFHPKAGLFRELHDSGTVLLCPTPDSEPFSYTTKQLGGIEKAYSLAGMIAAKCIIDSIIYNNNTILLPCHFTHSFLRSLTGLEPTIDQVQVDCPNLWSNLFTPLLQGNAELLQLTFAVSIIDHNGKFAGVHQLLPESPDEPVVESNKMQFIILLVKWLLYGQAANKIKAFKKGFWQILPPSIKILNVDELNKLMCSNTKINVSKMKKYTHFNVPQSDPVRIWFWKVVEAMSTQELERFVQFITGSPILPNGGFKCISPPITVLVCSSHPPNSLIQSHTCLNTLEVPRYRSFAECWEKMTTSINEGYLGFSFI